MTRDADTVERLALFLEIAEAVASLGDAIGSQLRGWAEVDFDPESEERPTAGAMSYIRDRLGSRSDDIAELLDVDPAEVGAVLRGEGVPR